jgi:hypothetical protein
MRCEEAYMDQPGRVVDLLSDVLGEEFAFVQAVGLVNDHLVTCFRYGEVSDITSR